MLSQLGGGARSADLVFELTMLENHENTSKPSVVIKSFFRVSIPSRESASFACGSAGLGDGRPNRVTMNRSLEATTRIEELKTHHLR
jgi:hypothetical protein